MRHFFRVSHGFLLSSAAIVAAAHASSLYSVQALGPLGNGAGMAYGFNSSGTAAGFVTDAQGGLTPATFSGGFTAALPGTGIASGINSSGTVVGTTFQGTDPAVTEWVNGKSKPLGISGYGMAINDTGQVAGGYLTSYGQLHAFVSNKGSLADLGTLGGSWSTATAINQPGQAAGTSTVKAGASHAFFWNGTGMSDLGTLGGANSYGNGLNALGEVVGSAQTSSGYLNAFAWSGNGMADLGTLGGSTSAAYGVNDSGEIVGYSLTAGNAATDGFVDSGGIMIDLNGLLPIGSGWDIGAAYAVNDGGDILAMATKDGQSYAVELYPEHTSAFKPAFLATPEPASMLLAGVGFIALARIGRRRRRGLIRQS